ncbi:MAG: autotransporter domain-containing protein [Rhizomicrobium sp.]
MNKLVRRLLSGASLATLQLCAGTAARAAGTTINTTRGAFTVTAGQSFDFIQVTGTGHITGDLTNEGTIGPSGTTIEVQSGGIVDGSIVNAAGGHVTATQVGILIHSGASIGGISNEGHILVSATSNGNRSITGVNYNSGPSAQLTNDGEITVKLTGSTTGDNGFALQGFGVFQQANGGGGAVQEALTNNGSIAVTVQAINPAQTGVVTNTLKANAASGVFQSLQNFTNGVATLTNNGSIALNAKAAATATGGPYTVDATAHIGMSQNAHGTASSVSLGMTNNGNLSLAATAALKGGAISDAANALVSKVFVQTAGDVTAANLTLTNSGTVTLNAKASLSGSTGNANAQISRIASQAANGGAGSAYESIDNSGTLIANATASINVGSAGKAEAGITGLFRQGANTAASITQALTNSGNVTIKVQAKAVATDTAEAGARLDGLIDQAAVGAGSISQSLTNNGTIALVLGADASGVNASAQASTCGCTIAINQFAVGNTASQTLSNSGSISLALNATAVALAAATASAAIGSGLLNQEAHAAQVAQDLDNKSLTVTLGAKANGAAAHATADADGTVLLQFATGTNVSQSITNSGSLSLAFAATANGKTEATANAFIDGAAILQRGFGTTNTTQSLTSNGTIALSFNAAAAAPTGPARASALATDALIEQFSAGSAIKQTANSGSLNVSFAATAVAGNGAQANAILRGPLVDQEAHGTSVVQSLASAGPVVLKLSANATGSQATASAEDTAPLLGQFGTGDKVTQTLSNTGSLTLTGSASAKGNLGSASANMDAIAAQRAGSAIDVSQTLTNTNSGTITIGLSANAAIAAAATRAVAAARLEDAVFSQSADGGDHIAQSMTNAGSISLKSFGSISGGGAGELSAAVGGGLFRQRVDGAATLISQSLTNSGIIAVQNTGIAKGAHSASVGAFAAIAGQTLTVPGSAVSPHATVSVSNSGSITIENTATATSPSYADAQANADGFGQRVRVNNAAGGVMSLSESNDGHIAMTLLANASAPGIAHAIASVTLFRQDVRNSPTAAESVSNTGTVSLHLNSMAKSKAAATVVSAVEASVENDLIDRQQSFGNVNATISFDNSGSIGIQAAATASGYAHAVASAGMPLIFQFATNNALVSPGQVAMGLTNSGTIDAAFDLTAKGGAAPRVTETVVAVSQRGDNVDLVETFDNSGTLKLSGSAAGIATAAAPAGYMGHDAKIRLTGLYAVAFGTSEVGHRFGGTTTVSKPATLSATVTNSGTMDVAAVASGRRALAFAYGAVVSAPSRTRRTQTSVSAGGVRSRTDQTGSASHAISGSINNSGTLSVSASAPGGRAQAGALIVDSSDADMPVTSSHQIAANASGAIADARGINVAGFASAYNFKGTTQLTVSSNRISTSINRSGFAPATLIASAMNNSGSISVDATGTQKAQADGIVLDAETVSATIKNSGNISVAAAGPDAQAAGIKIFAGKSGTANTSHFSEIGGVTARASQSHTYATQLNGNAFTGTLDNSGTIAVSAVGTGVSKANGVEIDADTVTGKILNEGLAWAYASGKTATAHAVLIEGASFGGTVTSNGTLTAVAKGSTKATPVGLDIDSTGAASAALTVHEVNAVASGGAVVAKGVEVSGSTVSGSVRIRGAVSAMASGSVSAAAQAVAIDPTTISGSFENTGAISATANGPGAIAQGLVVIGGVGNYTVSNDGGSISAVQNSGHGTAIDLSAAPSSVTIGLNSGSIYGNIVENPAGNAITVANGNTLFDGAINPSGALIGSLSIQASGSLTLAPGSAVNAGTYSQAGGIAFKALPDAGTVGTVHAANATISGPATLDLDLAGAPYGFATTYKLVFAANSLSGTWSVVAPDQALTFFSATGQYSAHEADIVLTRTAFDAIGGLTTNETSLGSALEKIYETSGGTGPLGPLFGAVFNLTPSQYTDALDSLSGVAAGEMSAVNQATAQSFLDQINGHLSDPLTGGDTVASLLNGGGQQLAANAAPTDVSPAQASSFSGTHVWGGGFQSGNSVDRTASGPAYSSHNNGLLAGVDVPLSNTVLLGVAGSYSTGDLKTEKFLGFGTFSAAQIAGYGRFTADNGIYASGDVSYGSFTNRLNRFVSIPGLAAGNVHGKFDAHSWGLYGETGWRFNPSDWATSLTPYAAISYLDAKSDGYTETGSFVAPLTIGSASSKATSSYLGLKLSTDWQLESATITPRITAAWQHDFTKNAWEMSAAFAAVPTVGFGLTGKDLARDGAYVDAGLTLHVADQADILLDYQGRFTSDRSDNAFLARANLKF